MHLIFLPIFFRKWFLKWYGKITKLEPSQNFCVYHSSPWMIWQMLCPCELPHMFCRCGTNLIKIYPLFFLSILSRCTHISTCCLAALWQMQMLRRAYRYAMEVTIHESVGLTMEFVFVHDWYLTFHTTFWTQSRTSLQSYIKEKMTFLRQYKLILVRYVCSLLP